VFQALLKSVVAFFRASFASTPGTPGWMDKVDHDFAVLKPDSQAPGYSIWFPALFVVGGLGIAFRALLKKSPA